MVARKLGLLGSLLMIHATIHVPYYCTIQSRALLSHYSEPYLLVMEYVMYGKLLTHLREHRMKQSSFFNFSKDGAEVGEALTSKDLTKFAYGVAKGMEYLVSKGVRGG